MVFLYVPGLPQTVLLLPQILMCSEYRHILLLLTLIKETKGKQNKTTLRKRKKPMMSIFGEKEKNEGCIPVLLTHSQVGTWRGQVGIQRTSLGITLICT